MKDLRQILCPVDFSDYSRRALDYAVAIARWHDATVTALHVMPQAPVAAAAYTPALGPLAVADTERHQVLAEIQAFAAMESAAGVRVETVVREGHVAAEIVEQATATMADLIVIGTHGRTGFDRLLLGSVTERVLRRASCPVLTVPRRHPDAVPSGPPLFDRILCPIDFSESSEYALGHAISMAQQSRGQLTILHVVSHEFESFDVATVAYDAGLTVGEFIKAREDAIQRRLNETKSGVERCQVETMLTHGKPWREILRVAAECHSDLIVIGVEGRGAADLLFLGSTTQHVVRRAECPVLTLRRS